MFSKKSLMKSAAALCLVAGTSSAMASTIVLDFEGAGDYASVLDFYNGGTDSQGNSGANYGIQFGANSLALVDSDAGGNGNFANEPSANTILFFLTGSAVLNYAPGFTTGFSFFYTSSTAASVNVYDGLNATGNLLGTILLNAQYSDNCVGDPNGGFCNWTNAGVAFSGLAKSIDFGGTVNQIGFDNITFGSAVADDGHKVPEPSSLLMLGLGILGLGAARKRASK